MNLEQQAEEILSSNPDYSGEHGAPMKGDGAPLYNVVLNGIYPKDFYETMWQYSHYGDRKDNAAMDIIRNYHGRINRHVTVYRAVPDTISRPSINPGDWVTTVRAYAKEHGEDNLNGKYKITQKRVRSQDIYTDGNSFFEWGYDPQPFDMDYYKALAARRKDKAALEVIREFNL